MDHVVVWDTEAPCGGGRKYVHFAAGQSAPMTAGAGAEIHTSRRALALAVTFYVRRYRKSVNLAVNALAFNVLAINTLL